MVDVPFVTWAFPISATGAVARTLPDRLKDHISVQEFTGVDPSGDPSSDNQGAFVSAISAATRSSKAAGRIYVPRGIYNFKSSVPLIPGLTPGSDNSFCIEGESAASTYLQGSFNGYILDAGVGMAGIPGGFSIENFRIINNDPTPFTSGCLRIGGIGPRVLSCWLQGMVGANFVGATSARLRDSYLQPALANFGGQPGLGTVGVIMAGDGGIVENTSAQLVDVGYAFSGTGMYMGGCHWEVCRTGIALGYPTPAGLTANSFGLGKLSGFSLEACSAEASGIIVDIQGPTSAGFLSSVGGQMHSGAGQFISPITIGSDLAYAGFRIPDGFASGLSFYNCGGGSGGVSDPAGASFIIGLPAAGNYRTGGSNLRGASGGLISAPSWKMPGSATGGSAVPGAANCARLQSCDFVPVWTFNDLAWGTLTGFSISGTNFSYSGSTRLTPEVGATLGGGSISPGTKIVSVDIVAKTGTVDKNQNVSSMTAMFYCNNPGDEYQIGDSPDPVWVVSPGVSNAGKPITTGGGSNRVTVVFKETQGYVIVG